jgi:hypothetical protein
VEPGSNTSIAKEGLLKVYDMEKFDNSLGEDLHSKFEVIASSYKFRRSLDHMIDEKQITQSDLVAVEELCSYN